MGRAQAFPCGILRIVEVGFCCARRLLPPHAPRGFLSLSLAASLPYPTPPLVLAVSPLSGACLACCMLLTVVGLWPLLSPCAASPLPCLLALLPSLCLVMDLSHPPPSTTHPLLSLSWHSPRSTTPTSQLLTPVQLRSREPLRPETPLLFTLLLLSLSRPRWRQAASPRINSV